MSEGSKMRLVEERSAGRMRVRVVECGCSPECTEHLIFASTHEQLWVVAGRTEWDAVDDSIELLLSETELDGMQPVDLIDIMTALVGVTWPRLIESRARAVLQFAVFDQAPPWMLRVPLERLWRTRGCVFGDDITRVPRALQALHMSYDAGGTVVDREVLG